ncbi:serine hydrolase domain-containing protein [Aminobacter sp. HY435]|uniref:serine hydrolase domain-containing protein n=1 Tax=Aminobacter sp. HY435 TaxID=2970917 RepID=UPI0022B9AFDD|nr:serine hydrolase [Aminobacter sp. HY435]
MRIASKIIKWFATLVMVAAAGLAAWLYFAPPALIRVGSGYAAKIVCSNVFVAGRDAKQVLADDVQAPGHPLLRLMSVTVDESAGTVRAGLFGVFGKGLAIAQQGAGCTAVPDGDIAAARLAAVPAAPAANTDALWPEGEKVDASQDPAIVAVLDDAGLAGPGMRAVVVVHNGRIIGERYGEGFSAATPLLGWSMTKTVTAAIIGTLVGDGKMSVDRTGLFEPWKADGRAAISLADLMAMSSGLEFNEDYGDVTDVTRMLYLEPDMAGFAEAKPLAQDVGKVFSYSSGTTLLLSRLWQDAVGDPAAALAVPREKLFGPLGMTSAVLEADARGTFAGSSYMYATGHDWARFGQFLLQDGVWNGARILPEGYVGWMREAAPADGQYGRGQLWLRGPEGGTPEGQNPDTGFDLPGDAFWMQGHDGQTVAIVPSANLVVVRLGLTPSKLHYKPQAMLSALVRAVQ